jgi:hypothetical protein
MRRGSFKGVEVFCKQRPFMKVVRRVSMFSVTEQQFRGGGIAP